MNRLSLLLSTTAFFILMPAICIGQTKATFRIDMQPQMKDSTFIPGKHTLELTGNQVPFSNLNNITLRDKPPVDSIYVATVRFPSFTNGEVLEYKFVIQTENGPIAERRFRLLQLNGQDKRLPVAGFNNFAH